MGIVCLVQTMIVPGSKVCQIAVSSVSGNHLSYGSVKYILHIRRADTQPDEVESGFSSGKIEVSNQNSISGGGEYVS